MTHMWTCSKWCTLLCCSIGLTERHFGIRLREIVSFFSTLFLGFGGRNSSQLVEQQRNHLRNRTALPPQPPPAPLPGRVLWPRSCQVPRVPHISYRVRAQFYTFLTNKSSLGSLLLKVLCYGSAFRHITYVGLHCNTPHTECAR